MAHCSEMRRPEGRSVLASPKRIHCLGFRIIRLVKSADMSSTRPWWQTLSLPLLLLPTNLKSNLDELENHTLEKPGNHLLPWNPPDASSTPSGPQTQLIAACCRSTHPSSIAPRRSQSQSQSQTVWPAPRSPPAVCGRHQCRCALGMRSSVDPRSAKYSFSGLAPLFLFCFHSFQTQISPRPSSPPLPLSLSSLLR